MVKSLTYKSQLATRLAIESMANRNQPQRWTDLEDAALIRLYIDCDLDGPELAHAMLTEGFKRTEGAIDYRLNLLEMNTRPRLNQKDLDRVTRRETIHTQEKAKAALEFEIRAAKIEANSVKPFKVGPLKW